MSHLLVWWIDSVLSSVLYGKGVVQSRSPGASGNKVGKLTTTADSANRSVSPDCRCDRPTTWRLHFSEVCAAVCRVRTPYSILDPRRPSYHRQEDRTSRTGETIPFVLPRQAGGTRRRMRQLLNAQPVCSGNVETDRCLYYVVSRGDECSLLIYLS